MHSCSKGHMHAESLTQRCHLQLNSACEEPADSGSNTGTVCAASDICSKFDHCSVP